MRFLGWWVLLLVFVDEVLALTAFGVWGWQQDRRWLWVSLLPLVGAQAWFWFASPKARFGHPVGRPLVKVIVFGLASLALLDAGHPTLAAAFLVFSVVVNALAQLPAVSALTDEIAPGGRSDLA